MQKAASLMMLMFKQVNHIRKVQMTGRTEIVNGDYSFFVFYKL